jgi:hypothetical protein
MPEAPAASASPSISASSLDPNAPPANGSSPPAGGSQTEYWGKGFIKEDGSFDHSRFEKAPDELKGAAKEFGRYKALDELLKGHVELRALSSKKGIAEPLPKDATPEAKAEHLALIRRALGAPDKIEGYALTRPENVPEGLWNKEVADAASKLAFEEGVSPAALKRFADLQLQTVQKGQEAQAQATKELWAGQEQLAREAAAKEGLTYDKAIDFAERAAKKYGGVDKGNPIFQNATFLMMAARVGKAMGEDKLVQGDTSDDALRSHTPESALSALNKIRDDKTNPKWFAYWNRDPENPKKEKVHPDHDAVVAEAKRLSALAYANRKR